jgi:hypothetical protein
MLIWRPCAGAHCPVRARMCYAILEKQKGEISTKCTYVRTYVRMYVYVCMFFVCVTYQWVFLYSLCTLNSVDIFAVIL